GAIAPPPVVGVCDDDADLAGAVPVVDVAEAHAAQVFAVVGLDHELPAGGVVVPHGALDPGALLSHRHRPHVEEVTGDRGVVHPHEDAAEVVLLERAKTNALARDHPCLPWPGSASDPGRYRGSRIGAAPAASYLPDR